MMNTLVVARYNENVDWVCAVPDSFRVYIYNKGEPITSGAIAARATVIERPNQGRESETYLWHLLNDPHPEDDAVLFTQGDPFEHNPLFLKLLEKYQTFDGVDALSCQWKVGSNVPPKRSSPPLAKAWIRRSR